ncbi:hypothetical protein [Primorskyibacter sp. 2E233]|uniref:hypothetical protein n=1 Tax=Primorskyibacter sp. 2E233 TaxID=3413431 RepID=UPI003BEFCBBE
MSYLSLCPARAFVFALVPVLLSATLCPAQTVLTGDYSVDGSLCVGSGCTNSEAFPDSTGLKVKQFDTRLLFEDISTNAGFPTTDWELTINDIFQNGENYFAIRNVDTDTQVFRVDANAPANALYVDGTGQMGLGTSLPQGDIHVQDGSAATIRLQQDTSGGNAAQTFDLGVDDTGLYVSNIGSGLVPFEIQAGALAMGFALTSAGVVVNGGDQDVDFVIKGDDAGVNFAVDAGTNNIGLGTDLPQTALHVQRGDGSASVLVENTAGSPSAVREMFAMKNNGGAYFTLDNTQSGTTWFFVHENSAPNRFIITDGVADGPEMTVSADGDLVIQGQLFSAGSCSAGCDRVFDADYPLPTIAEQAAMMRTLHHLPNVGPTPEDGPFNITAMTGGMLNELEKAHLYIAQLHAENARQEARFNARIARLEALVEALAAR